MKLKANYKSLSHLILASLYATSGKPILASKQIMAATEAADFDDMIQDVTQQASEEDERHKNDKVTLGEPPSATAALTAALKKAARRKAAKAAEDDLDQSEDQEQELESDVDEEEQEAQEQESDLDDSDDAQQESKVSPAVMARVRNSIKAKIEARLNKAPVKAKRKLR